MASEPIDPLLHEVPPELATDRLRLRVPRTGDGAMVCTTVRQSYSELKEWMLWATKDYSQRDAELWCRRGAVNFLSRVDLAYLIFLGSEHVGNVSLFAFNWKVPCCEIGYWLATAQWGRGLMSEAVLAAAQMAWDALAMERIEIRTDVRNLRSAAVAERCGFRLEGVLRHDSRDVAGALRDTRVYARLRARA